MKRLHVLYLFSLLCSNMLLFGQETNRFERIQQLRERIIACKILLKKAKTENNPTKIGELQAIINRLEERAQQL